MIKTIFTMLKPQEVVDKMMQEDAFSQWLGIKVVSVESGKVELSMEVRDEMLNGFSILHGGISYSLADSALAFASNSYGRQAVSVETSISHLKKINSGDILQAFAKKINSSHKIALYEVKIICSEEMVALFKGTVYISSKEWV